MLTHSYLFLDRQTGVRKNVAISRNQLSQQNTMFREVEATRTESQYVRVINVVRTGACGCEIFGEKRKIGYIAVSVCIVLKCESGSSLEVEASLGGVVERMSCDLLKL